jgi:hypothetical protein
MKESIANLMAIVPNDLKADVILKLKDVIDEISATIVKELEMVTFSVDVKTTRDYTIDMHNMMSLVSKEMCIDTPLLWSKKRDRDIVFCRQILMWVFRIKYPAITLRIISDIFHRDHATIIHAIKAVEGGIYTDPIYRGMISNLLDLLQRNDFDMSLVVIKFESLTKKALR